MNKTPNHNITPELIEFAKEEAGRINKLKSEYIGAADDAARQAGEVGRTIHGHLIVFAGTIISISAVFINSTSSPKLGEHSQWLLITAWGAFVVSIIAGIYGLDNDARFLRRWWEYNYRMAKSLSSGKYTTASLDNLKKENLAPDSRSSSLPGAIQYVFATLGVVIFLILMVHLLVIKK